MNKILVLFALAIMLLVMPAAASAEPLVFWHSMTDAQSAVMDAQAKKYMEANPTINVEIRRFATPGGLYTALMTTDAASLPDIAAIDSSWQTDLRNASRLIPVDDSILRSVRIAIKMDTYAPLWKASVFEDKLWTLPYFAYNYAVVYDSDAFKKTGIKTVPANRAQLYSYASKLKNAGFGGLYVPVDKSPREIAFYFTYFFAQAQPSNYALISKGLDGEAAEKALFWLHDMMYDTKVATSDVTKASIFVGTPEDLLKAAATRPNMRVARWGGNNKEGGIVLTSLAIMNKTGANAEKSWFYLYYLGTFAQLRDLTLASPVLPSNKQVTLCPAYFDMLEKYPGLRNFLALLGKGYVKSEILDYEKFAGEYGSSVLDALNNRKGVTQAVRDSMQVVNGLVSPVEAPPQPTGQNSNKY